NTHVVKMSDFLKVSTVQVVQAIDLAELDKTLKWLVSKVQELPTAEQSNQKTIADSLLQDQIDALRRENNHLKDALAQLQSKQSDMEVRLDTKQDRDQADPVDPNEANLELERRVAALEQQVEQMGPTTSGSTDAEEVAAEPRNDGPDLNTQFQELLAGHRALAATVSGLQHELDSKPNRGELDLKANRSELDALLRAGVSAAPVGDVAPAQLAVGADGSVDNSALVEAVNKAAAEVAAMRGQVAVIQDRIQNKAEQGGVDDLAAQLAAIKSRGPVAAPSIVSRASMGPADAAAAAAAAQATGQALDNVVKRLEELEVRVAAGAAASTPGSSTGNDDKAVDAIGSLTDVQPLLKDIYARVDSKADRTALEETLRRLQDLTAALDSKADVSSLQDMANRMAKLSALDKRSSLSQSQQQQPHPAPPPAPQLPQWLVSHEVSENPLADLAELRAQVSELAARVTDLANAPPPPPAPVPPLPLPLPPVPPPPPIIVTRNSNMSGDGGGLDVVALQAALATLQGQLGELGTRLAGKADAGEVTRLELSLNSKADLDELAELQLALGGKADAAAVGDLQMAVAAKADQAALEEVKLTAALAADLASGSTGDADAKGGTSGGYQNLLGAIQGMVADKAGKNELVVLQSQVSSKAAADDVAMLRAALDSKASAAELAALSSQQSLRAANSEEIASLDQRMGDVFAELAKIRADMAALPVDALAAAAAQGSARSDGCDSAGLERVVSALSREVGTLREGLDTVAHAANVLAVGLDSSMYTSSSGISNSGLETRYSDAGGAGGKENRSPRGGYERLLKLLGSGEYRHKMDAFDPTALQQMAQKLAYLEATVKSPAMGRIGAGGVGGVDYGIKELERQVKRLATDVRLMKDKVIDPVAVLPNPRMNPGDHAMLAARPITGYRCMACDRPLDQLDVLPGPHIPTQQLPIRVPAASDTATRTQVRSGRGDPLSPQSSSQRLPYNNDLNVRNVQNWYKDTTVVAAEALPREHVGPHLPPGGWRPSNPGSVSKPPPMAQGSLPALSGQRRGSPTEFEQKQPSMIAPSMDGVGANVTLPQIS
ncbi:hypothetical protein Agub_g2058, partial [Astrephomene gubernaculifera]